MSYSYLISLEEVVHIELSLSDFQTPYTFYYTLATTENIYNIEHSCDFSMYVQWVWND